MNRPQILNQRSIGYLYHIYTIILFIALPCRTVKHSLQSLKLGKTADDCSLSAAYIAPSWTRKASPSPTARNVHISTSFILHVLWPKCVVSSNSKKGGLLPRVMSDSLDLLQLGSVLMSVALVITKGRCHQRPCGCMSEGSTCWPEWLLLPPKATGTFKPSLLPETISGSVCGQSYCSWCSRPFHHQRLYRCPCSALTPEALCWTGPVPHLGSTIADPGVMWLGELAPKAGEQKSNFRPLLAVALSDLAWTVLESLPWWYAHRKAVRLMKSATT